MPVAAITGWRTAKPAAAPAAISASAFVYHSCNVLPQLQESPLLFILALLM